MMKNLTFQEKSLWLTLIAVVLTYLLYYINVMPPIDGKMLPPHIFQFAYYMGVMVIFIAISHIAIAIKQKNTQEPVDEREKLIGLKANSISGYILQVGIFISIIVALIVPGNYWFIHTINFFAVLAEVINQVQQLRLFRKGF
jgi:hypothetical protein